MGYGIGDSWHNWCKCEGMDWVNGSDYQVIVPDNLNILQINDSMGMYTFNSKYGISDIFANLIKWNEVIKEYDGIEINPYQWSLRLEQDFFWYYSWDCASGCIWNAENVKLKMIKRKYSKKSISDVLEKLK